MSAILGMSRSALGLESCHGGRGCRSLGGRSGRRGERAGVHKPGAVACERIGRGQREPTMLTPLALSPFSSRCH